MEQLVVAGNGMAGVACVEEILKYRTKFDITMFGAEPHPNYSRIMLSQVLSGETHADEIVMNGLDWYQRNDISLKLGVRITGVDPEARTVTAEDGSVACYDKLVLATGSSAIVPPIENVDLQGVSVFRSLDDTRALLSRTGPGVRAVVIGGGLLGLEAARGLQLRGCQVTVVHILDTLMEKQLDHTAGEYLRRKLEQLGIRILLDRTTTALLGDTHVQAVQFHGGETIPAALVVIAAGIRPNVELALQAGLNVRRGIVVNDAMETSVTGIFAAGECVEHRGGIHGSMASVTEQAKALAAAISGNAGLGYRGTAPVAKLRITGVDVFSAGNLDETIAGTEVVRYEDASLGIYKKLVVRNKRLDGVILVGDANESGRYMEWLRAGTDLTGERRNLLFPKPLADPGVSVAEIADRETVCACLGLTKGGLIQAIHEQGIQTLPQLKQSTRACTACESCASTCEQILLAVAPTLEGGMKKVLCSCLPFSQDQLRDIILSQRLRSVQDVLDIYGNGAGCLICKPALAYVIDMQDRSARYPVNRVQTTTWGAVPGPPGIGLEFEKRLEGVPVPHKLKVAVAASPHDSMEASLKDVGLIVQSGNWQVVVGGATGKNARKADLLITVETTEQAFEAAEIFLQYYRENAPALPAACALERMCDFVQRLGIETIRKETVYAPEPVRMRLLARLRKSKALAKEASATELEQKERFERAFV